MIPEAHAAGVQVNPGAIRADAARAQAHRVLHRLAQLRPGQPQVEGACGEVLAVGGAADQRIGRGAR
jgi:hypothetical protein